MGSQVGRVWVAPGAHLVGALHNELETPKNVLELLTTNEAPKPALAPRVPKKPLELTRSKIHKKIVGGFKIPSVEG